MKIKDIIFSSEGEQLSGTLYKAEAGKAGILIFGGGANIPHKNGYYPVWQKQMAEDGISSFSFDFRGVGESSGTLENTSIVDRIEDAKAAFEAFKEALKGQKMYAAGISMGAPVAISIADLVSGLILISPAAYSIEARQKKFGPEFSAAIRVPKNWENSPDFWNLKAYSGKILLAYGLKDDVVPQEILKIYHEIVENKGGDILAFESVGHRFMRDDDEFSIKARETLRNHIKNFTE